jgi:hypothetical protein
MGTGTQRHSEARDGRLWPMTSLAAMQQICPLLKEQRTRRPVHGRRSSMELSATRGESASACRTGVAWESPGQGGHRHAIPPACGIDDGGGKFRRRRRASGRRWRACCRGSVVRRGRMASGRLLSSAGLEAPGQLVGRSWRGLGRRSAMGRGGARNRVLARLPTARNVQSSTEGTNRSGRGFSLARTGERYADDNSPKLWIHGVCMLGASSDGDGSCRGASVGLYPFGFPTGIWQGA